MPAHTLKRYLPYSSGQLFDLVADVEAYPQFIPWCKSVRILEREEQAFLTEMVIGYKWLRDSFISRDILTPPGKQGEGRIDVEYCQGPFHYLRNSWVFTPHQGPKGKEACLIEFMIDFEFRSPFFNMMMNSLFHKALQRMVVSFENRAHSIYGDSGGAVSEESSSIKARPISRAS